MVILILSEGPGWLDVCHSSLSYTTMSETSSTCVTFTRLLNYITQHLTTEKVLSLDTGRHTEVVYEGEG